MGPRSSRPLPPRGDRRRVLEYASAASCCLAILNELSSAVRLSGRKQPDAGIPAPFMNSEQKPWFRLTPASDANAATPFASREPSRWEVLLMLATIFAVHLCAVCRVSDFWELATSSTDDMDYVELAQIIRNWHSGGGRCRRTSGGFPMPSQALPNSLLCRN